MKWIDCASCLNPGIDLRERAYRKETALGFMRGKGKKEPAVSLKV